MAQVIPLRPHTFRLDNCIIDQYAAEMGAIGVAIYAALQRYADRTTGQCWPSVSTIATALRLSKNCVKKYLHRLARLGLIDIAPRHTADGDPTSNLYTVHDPTQTDAVPRRPRQGGGVPARGGGVPARGGGSPHALPPPGRGGAPHASEQGLKDPDLLTSASAPKNAEQPCENRLHEHRSPVPGLRICFDCFRCWQTPLEIIPTALDMTVGEEEQQTIVARL